MDYFARIWMFLVVIANIQICQAYRILVMVPIPTGSHAMLGDALVKILLKAGHEIVYVTAMSKRLEANPKLVEVDVSSNAKYFPANVLNLSSFLENTAESPSPIFFVYQSSIYSIATVGHEEVQRVLNDGKKFDLIIADWAFSDIFVGLPALLDCPLIWLSTLEPHSLILNLIDGNLHPAHNADFGFKHIPPFSFLQRIQQLAMQTLVTVYREFHIYFKETEVYEKLYTPMMEKIGKTLPPYEELRYNASLVLSNSHVSISQAARLPPNFISIGGYHVDPEVKPLPEAVKNIMDNAKNGVIYFSMGSIMKSKDFPQKLKTDLLNVFGRLKQTVLWKYEEDFTDLPDNVHILKWASQQSILAHPNCILFISHGGLLSITESIHFAVPVIGVPGFADQFINILRAEKKGFAKKVELSYDLAKDLEIAIKEVLGNPRYKEKVEELSFVYHDRPVHPRKELQHWVEHVIKTRGAPLLKSPALQLTLYQKFYLDLAILIVMLGYIPMRLIKFIMISQKSVDNKMGNKLGEKKRN